MKSQGESPDSFTRILYLESLAGVEKVLCLELNEVCVESYVGKVSVKSSINLGQEKHAFESPLSDSRAGSGKIK